MAAGEGSVGRHWHCKRLSVLYFPFSETTPNKPPEDQQREGEVIGLRLRRRILTALLLRLPLIDKKLRLLQLKDDLDLPPQLRQNERFRKRQKSVRCVGHIH